MTTYGKSNQDTSETIPSDLAAVNGTLVLKSPAAGDNVYQNSAVEIVVELDLTGTDTIPAQATASLDQSSLPPGFFVSGNPQRKFTLLNGPPDAKYTTSFYVLIPGDQSELTFTVTANSAYINAPPLVPAAISLLTGNTATYTFSDPLYLPVVVSGPPLTDANSAHYSATLTDGTGSPIKGYLVEWRQLWDAGAFTATSAYADSGASERLTPDYLNYDQSKNAIVRTKTNAQGLTELYLTPYKRGVYFDVESAAVLNQATEFSPVTMVGPAVLNVNPPYLNIASDNLDTILGDYVFVSVDVGNAALGDSVQFLLFLNNQFVGIEILNIEENPVPTSINIPVGKFAFSSSSDGGSGSNTLFYTRSSSRQNELTSMQLTKILKGNRGGNKPPDNVERVLQSPFIYGAGQSVTTNVIEDGIDCRFNIYESSNWSPQVGDVVIGALYANGWNKTTGNAFGNTIPVQWPAITDTDIANGYIGKTLSKYLLQGYGPNPDTGYMGKLYFDAYVQVQGQPDKIYAKYNTYDLWT